MGFWIFMLLMGLLLPVTMIVLGSCFAKKAPAEINSVFGYRTRMSMLNQDTWTFAHHYSGVLYRRVGWVLLPISVIAMLLLLGKETGVVGTWGGGFVEAQVLFLIGPIIPTERALRKTFDQNGQRKNRR